MNDNKDTTKDFFISYNTADRFWAEWIAWQLEEEGFTTIIQAWDFRPGSNFVLAMQNASKQAERTIAVLSPNYLTSRFAQPEWAAAFAQDPTGELGVLLPIRVLECDLAGLLPQIIYIDLIDLDEDEAKVRLLAGVNRARAKPQKPPSFPGATPHVEHTVDEPRRFPGTLPLIWNVPHRRNPNFTGRGAILDALRGSLTSGSPTAVTQAIAGLGGVGKTQLAIEYIYRNSLDYDAVWWVSSEQPTTLRSDFGDLAVELELASQQDELDARVNASMNWLNHNAGWLLVFDNAPDRAAVRDYVPQGAGGHTIITSRDQVWGNVASTLTVEVFERPESIEFLTKRTGGVYTAKANELADELGDLPLALEQAAAYMEEVGASISEYLDLFREHRKALFGLGDLDDQYRDTVATTWDISFQRVQSEIPQASELLKLLAFFAPDDIPRILVADHVDKLPEPLDSELADTLLMSRTLGILRRYSLVTLDDDSLSVHRLVQAVMRDSMRDDDGEKWVGAAVSIVNAAFPYELDAPETWAGCASLLSHSVAACGHSEELGFALEETSRLLNESGLYLEEIADYEGARKNFERAIEIGEKVYGLEHPSVATRLNNLGNVLRDLGDYEGARKNFERAIEIGEKVYGLEHPEVATFLSNLGNVLIDLGDYEGARKNFERAIEIGEKVYGLEHPSVATRLNNLGNVLRDLGDYEGARKNYERAIEIFRKFLGEDHPSTQTVLSHLRQLDELENRS